MQEIHDTRARSLPITINKSEVSLNIENELSE